MGEAEREDDDLAAARGIFGWMLIALFGIFLAAGVAIWFI